MQNAAILNTLQGITTGTIYLMGGSFILGSLFTLLLLVLLDFMSRNKDKGKKS
jgi:hypothetical protein